MDTLQLPKKKEKVADKEEEEEVEEERPKQQGVVKDRQPTRQQQSSISTTSSTSPTSASSSPSHEFSFTISLHPSSTTTMTPDKANKSHPSSFAIDLSPADDIFFHGHLLPLHLLSHLPVSPRSSTNSFDSFNLPIKDVLEDSKPKTSSSSNSSSTSSSSTSTTTTTTSGTKGRSNKLKTLSLFGLSKWQKGCEVSERDDDEAATTADDGEKKKKKRKIRFDVGHILKRYVRMVRPLLLFSSGRKENKRQLLRQQPHSFSGNLSWRGNNCNQEMRRGRRGGGGGGAGGGAGGGFSAPASIRTSPSNSGLLLATEILPSHTTDSTMEELHNAIQAAIAHCKNSVAMKEEKLKF
ncbi:BRI1 kinase inhibitor 1 [Macadamia integrifolia]|uniref:BRI1 kinase inhibitor 1 n=1 Tax=Macadamia integrifolia TaxID=60698 RepID=UPI001C4EA50F|nr:BRI1 kinase inhibitor 1 [Macadamia integrifolia]